jgi:hypothetical protein
MSGDIPMRDRNPTLPPPHVLRAFPKHLPIQPRCRINFSTERIARIAREIAEETANEVASFPRGTNAPPADLLRALRRPRSHQVPDMLSPAEIRARRQRARERRASIGKALARTR